MAEETVAGRGDLVAAKVRFRGEGTGLAGLLFLVADPAVRRIDRLSAIVSHGGGIVRTDLQQAWRSFEEVLHTARFSGGVAQNLSREVQTYMLTHLSGREGEEIHEALLAGRLGPAREILADLLGRVLGDGSVGVEAATERIRPEDLFADEPLPEASGGGPAAPEAATDGPPGRAEEAAAPAPEPPQPEIVIKVEPLLSPLRGVAASKLQPGQRILVRPVETSELGRHVVRLTAQGLGVPENQIPVAVLSVQSIEFERVKIRTAFGPGIVGVSIISPELRVATAAGETAIPVPAVAAGAGDSSWATTFLLLLVLALLGAAYIVVAAP
jgi:hypothetical protein